MPAVTTQFGATMPDNGLLALKAYCYCDGQIAVNTVFYRYEKAIGTIMKFGEIAEAAANLLSPDYRAVMSENASFLGCKAQPIMDPPVLLSGIAEFPTQGEWMEPPLPTQCCPIITWTTDIGGPAGRGRIYLPFFPNSAAAADGTINDAFLPLMTNIAVDFLTLNAVVGLSATYNLYAVIYNRTTFATTRITGKVRRDKFGTQKRRGIYGKVNSAVIT